MAQSTVKKTTRPRPAPKRIEKGPEPKPREHITKEEIDAVLDEIDNVLEENAEEFVRNYVQKGGQ